MIDDPVTTFPTAHVKLYFKNDEAKQERTFIFILEPYQAEKHILIDDNVFYYCNNGEEDLRKMKADGEAASKNDFVVLDYEVLVESIGDESMERHWIDPMGDEWEEEDEDDFEDDPEELP